VRAIALDVYGLRLPRSIGKEELASRLIAHLIKESVEIPSDIGALVADIGIVHISDENYAKGEVVLLRANALNNMGEQCVASYENLAGWIVRAGKLCKEELINSSNISWGRLVEKRKELTICMKNLKDIRKNKKYIY